MSNGTNVVATLPCANSGALVVELGQPSEENTLSCGVSYKGYATLYSPFQLTIPDSSEVEVFAPTYEDGKLVLSKSTRLHSRHGDSSRNRTYPQERRHD